MVRKAHLQNNKKPVSCFSGEHLANFTIPIQTRLNKKTHWEKLIKPSELTVVLHQAVALFSSRV